MEAKPTRKKYQTMVLVDYGAAKLMKTPLAGGPAPMGPMAPSAPAPAPAPAPGANLVGTYVK